MPMKLIAEFSFPAFGPDAPGSVVLRDAGPSERMRYVTHWRNDQVGGTGQGNYFRTLEEGFGDFRTRIRGKLRDLAHAEPRAVPQGPFKVDLWGSPREQGNDDNWTGTEAPTLELALRYLELLTGDSRHAGWAHAYLDAADRPLLHQVNPAPRAAPGDDLDRSEAANLAGMAHGARGRNEALGEDVEEEAPYGFR